MGHLELHVLSFHTNASVVNTLTILYLNLISSVLTQHYMYFSSKYDSQYLRLCSNIHPQGL